MPRRKSVHKIPTDEVQGEGSWVEISSMRIREIRDVIRQRDALTGADAFEKGIELLVEHVVGWNWADEEGKPLPQPSEDPDVFDDLTDEEVDFLTDLFNQSSEKAKNLKRRSSPRSG